MRLDHDRFPLDPDPLHPDDWFTDDPRVPAPWEHQRTPRRNWGGCVIAILGCLASAWLVNAELAFAGALAWAAGAGFFWALVRVGTRGER